MKKSERSKKVYKQQYEETREDASVRKGVRGECDKIFL